LKVPFKTSTPARFGKPHHPSNAMDGDALTCSFQWAEDYKTKCCQKYQKDEVDEEIPKE